MSESEPQELQYEPGEVVAEQKRRRVHLLLVVGVIGLIALSITWRERASIRRSFEDWQFERAYDRTVAASERFPIDQLTYAVPPAFYSSVLPIRQASVYGPISTASQLANGEAAALTDGKSDASPSIFLGELETLDEETELVLLCFGHTSVEKQDYKFDADFFETPIEIRAGYHISLHGRFVNRQGQYGPIAGGENWRIWIGPLSMLNWKYESSDGHVAPLPLSFYGSWVDPADPSVAVIQIKLGEHTGLLRYSIANGVESPQVMVEWDDPPNPNLVAATRPES